MAVDHKQRQSRRDFLKSTARACAIAPLLMGSQSGSGQTSSKPRNIIFILIDDMRWDSMGCMGHPFLQTPNLDRLARGGCLFRNSFVTTSLCSPSRASILSGQYAHVHGVLDNSTPLPADTPIFPIELQKAGYDTAYVGKWHMGGESDAPRPGFNHWMSFKGQGVYYNPLLNVNGEPVKREGYIADIITDYSIEWLKRDRDKPFFLYMGHKSVHAPFEPSPRHRDAYATVEIPHPDSMADTPRNYEGKPLWVRRQRHSWHGVDYMYHDSTLFDQFILDYNRTMLGVDESVGRLLDALKELGRLDSTLILFTSDNGFLHGEHGLIDKRCMYEESIRVPMLAHCPELIPAGSFTERIVLNVDVAPTILEAARAPIPKTVQGKSFLPLAQGRPAPWRDAFLYEYFWERAFPQTPTVFGVRGEEWKLTRCHGILDLDEFYNLQDDPKEMHNRIDDAASFEARQKMQQRLAELMKEFGATDVPSFRSTNK
jgi:N-acetylglucosamine-6-sulfatase